MLDLVPWIVSVLVGIIVGTLGHLYFASRRHQNKDAWWKKKDE